MAKLGMILDTTANRVEDVSYENAPRTYLGMSSIGSECMAKLWLGFHWASPPDWTTSKSDRIFSMGHEFEKIIIRQLKDAGFEVFRKLPDGSEEEMFGYKDEVQEEFIGFAGHAKGHNDGRIRGLPEAPKTDHLLEIKTAKDSSFKTYYKGGVKKANPVYYGQMQRYMRATGLTRSLFVICNKDTAQLYFERVEADSGYQNDLIRKEQSLIMSHQIPTRAFNEGFYKCGWCNQREVCRGEKEPMKTCRTCEYCDIEDEGVWSCEKQDGKHLTSQEQWEGCKKYKLGWELDHQEKVHEKPKVIFKQK